MRTKGATASARAQKVLPEARLCALAALLHSHNVRWRAAGARLRAPLMAPLAAALLEPRKRPAGGNLPNADRRRGRRRAAGRWRACQFSFRRCPPWTARRSPHLAHLQAGPPASSQPPCPRPTAGRPALLEAPTACHRRCLRPLTCRAPLHLPVLPQLSAMPFLGHPELHSASSLDFFDSLPQVGASAGRGLAAAAAGADAARAGSCTLRCTCPGARRAHAPYLWRPAAVR